MIGRLASALIAAALLPMGSALADVIDGEWCHADGRHFSIKGPEIMTPGGNRLEGRYTRHSFDYVIPPAEPASGQTVSMILRNENTVHLSVGPAEVSVTRGPVQVWLRCAPRTSLRALPPTYVGGARRLS